MLSLFAMHAGHHDPSSLHTHHVSDSAHDLEGAKLPTLTASASSKDGKVLISVANLDLDGEKEIVLDLRGGQLEEVVALVLGSDHVAAFNAPEHRDAVAPRPLQVQERDGQLMLRLPAHSFATVGGTLVGGTPEAPQAAGSAAVVGFSALSKPCLKAERRPRQAPSQPARARTHTWWLRSGRTNRA